MVEGRDGTGQTQMRIVGLGTPNHPLSIIFPVAEAGKTVLWDLVGYKLRVLG